MMSLVRPRAVTVRPVGSFDLGRLARLHRICFDDAWSRTDLAHLLALPGGFGMIARLYDRGFAGLDAMRGVGFALCRVVREECELLSIGVVPPYRRRGVGEALLRGSMERCAMTGADTMFLEVAIDNESAQRLYEDNGFAQVGTRADYYQRHDGKRIAALTMRAELKQTMLRRQS